MDWHRSCIARRHGHVFRMALHNEGDWRMETWQRARQGELSCLHTPIPELCNAILNTCQMPSRFYIIPSNMNKSQTRLLKPFTVRDLMEGHICRQNTLMFALVFCFELRARAARTCCHCHLAVTKSDSWRQARSVKTAKKSWTVPQCGHVTLICVQMASKQANVEFSSYIFQFTRLHGVAVMQGLSFWDSVGPHTLQISQVVRTVRHGISCCAPTIHWKCDAQMQNWQIKSPPALWKHLSFQCLGVIVALNGKSATMLLEPTRNKLKQWLVIEKSVNKCNFFPDIFEILTKWMKMLTDRQICEDQIVTLKQSHILYQGLLFLTWSTCVIVDARSHTCKSHDFIPRYDIIVWSWSDCCC